MPRSRAVSSLSTSTSRLSKTPIAILRGLKERYELYHGVHITDDALVAAVQLSTRYITERFLPDKAIDLIDEASSALRLSLENMPPVSLKKRTARSRASRSKAKL